MSICSENPVREISRAVLVYGTGGRNRQTNGVDFVLEHMGTWTGV